MCDFGGNDLGGLGAVFAYASIAGATTILVVFAVFHFLAGDKNSSDDDGDGNFNDEPKTDQNGYPVREFHQDMFDLSLGFWDTVVWFAILGGVAGCWSLLKHHAGSVYEIILTVIVTCMVLNATAALSCLYLYKNAHKEPNHITRVVAQVLAAMVNGVVVGVGIFINQKWSSFLDNFDKLGDLNCYRPTDYWAKLYLQIAVFLQLGVLIVVVSYAFLFLLTWWNSKQPNGQPGYRTYGWLTAVLGFVFAAVMWGDFALILNVRWSATATFGKGTYDDMDLSYGQVTAAGLAFQSLWFLGGILSKRIWTALSS